VNPKIRATGVLVEDGCILLLEQGVKDSGGREWSLPGGTLEVGETLEECVIREIKEETGLTVVVGKLLYVCDRIAPKRHAVHVTFAVKRLSGELKAGTEPEPGANPIKSVSLVPITVLDQYGFDDRFRKLAEAGFPGSGTYQGAVTNIGL
jgi:mutator protein MutT